MPKSPNNVVVGDRYCTTLSKTYKIRTDGALNIPLDALAMLRWSLGKDCWLTIDPTNKRLVVTEERPNIEPPQTG